MMRSWAVVCVFLGVGCAGGLRGQASGAAGQSERIATVNFTAAVLQTAEGQKEFGALQAKYAPRQAQLQALSNEVEGLRKQLGVEGSKLSDAERQVREKALDGKEKQLQREGEDFRNDSQTDSQQVFQRVAQKVYAFLPGYAQKEGYTMLVDRGSDASPVVWYAAKGVDVTEDLIRAYNAHAEGGAGGSSPARNGPETMPSAPSPH